MAHGSKFATVVLSAACLSAGLLVAPALGETGPGSAPGQLAAPRELVPAPPVKPGRIEVSLTMSPPLFGSKPRITLIGVGGRAKGVTRKVRVRPLTVVKGLPPGRYRVSAQTVTIRKQTITPRVTPARVRLTPGRGATFLVRYRMPGVPDGFQGNEYVPVPVATDTRFTTITAGALHTCGIDRAGKAWCWGNDYKGRLGDGKDDQASEYKPVAVAGTHRFTTLAASWSQTCGVDTAGKAWCWGSDADGKLGDGDDGQADEYSPVAVAGGHTFTTLAGGNTQTCGIDTAGTAWCWGRDDRGQVGDGDDGQGNEYAPVAVASGVKFTSVTAGNLHTCGLDTAGTAWCWGSDYGSLGDGDDGQADEYSPVTVAGGHTFTTLTAGKEHTCGVDTNGMAWCWGADGSGTLGHRGDDRSGNTYRAPEPTPVTVAGGHPWNAVAAGYEHTCGVDTTGAAWCWGDDGFGQVGDGDEYVPAF